MNPIFVDLLRGEFRKVAGVADYPGVALVVDEARSYLSRSQDKFSVIQMSLVDTWAATGAGAFSLSENALYTVQAWRVFTERLADDGIFTVSRWHAPANLGETGRIVSLAVASLLQRGVANPSQHIAMVTTNNISTLLSSNRPFSQVDVARLAQMCDSLQYSLVVKPGVEPENPDLRAILAARSPEDLSQAIAGKSLNYEPPTDEKPYFFNMLRLSRLRAISEGTSGVVLHGNLLATLTLTALIGCLIVLTIVTVAVPLAVRARLPGAARQPSSPRILWGGGLYFSLIGAGFMFVEIGMIQRLSVFLSHPAYALGIVLFTVILSAGIGSYLSGHLPVTSKSALYLLTVLTVLSIIAVRFVLSFLLASMTSAPMLSRIAPAILTIFPLGMLMGCFFPTGMRTLQSAGSPETPWFWALNGIFGVLCSALAVFISIYFGISTNFYIAAASYALVPISIRMIRHAPAA